MTKSMLGGVAISGGGAEGGKHIEENIQKNVLGKILSMMYM